MAYKIVYGTGNAGVNTHSSRKKCNRLRKTLSVVFCLICCSLLVFELHRSAVIFGRTAQIQNALSSLTSELEQGRPIGDAVSAFCEEILTGAGA